LLSNIYEHIRGPEVKTVLDVFSGTARVSFYLKQKGLSVTANDSATYAKVLADAYLLSDINVHHKPITKLVEDYNFHSSKRKHGWFTETYCEKSKFFQPHNGERVDYIREDLETKGLDPIMHSIMLTSLMEASDRVDSTCGVQMAYLKGWATRSEKDLELRVPKMEPGKQHCCTYQLDALEFVQKVNADVAYIDPPYNQHSYLGNYHIWESLCLWDKPEVYGKACKRIDVKDRKSKYNSKVKAKSTFIELINALQTKKIVVSFNDEGFISKSEMEEILAGIGSVSITSKDYKRYVGAKIGIHNPQGEKVGVISHLRNKEYLYVVDVNKD
jgi:adenine-specific DNA-methyltransferase